MRDSMKRAVLSILLAGFFCTAQAQQEIRLWHALSGSLGAALESFVQRFNDSQKEYWVLAEHKGSYEDTMIAALAAQRQGIGPHLVQVYEVGTAHMMAARGAYRPLWQVASESHEPIDAKAFLPAVAGYFSDESGRLLALPFNLSTPILFYNKTAFRKARLDPEKPPATWYEMPKAMGELVDAGYECVYTTVWPSWVQIENMSTWHNQDFATKVFIGDLHGRVWKLDCSAMNPSLWTFDVFYDFGSGQPIASGAALLKDPGADQLLVFTGTGADTRVTSAAGFKLAGLVDNDADGFGGKPIALTSGGSFLVSLAAGHRVWATPVTADTSDGQGAVFFGSSLNAYDAVACGRRFTSALYGYAARSGLGAYDLDATQAGTQSQVSLGAGKLQGLYVRDAHLYLSRSGGLGVVADTSVRGDTQFPAPSAVGGNTKQRLMVSMFRQSLF